MTACIVGWAHTLFGKLANDTEAGALVVLADHREASVDRFTSQT